MIRYHLDDLGWYQFEWLVQSLLKAECGLLVESWGGSGDYGRDAYSKGRLAFPKNRTTKGPFIFQAKFVQNANSTNANYETSIIGSLEKEIKRINQRVETKKWIKPNYYVLVTNAPVSSAIRKRIEVNLVGEKTAKNVLVLGGNDICDLLDNHETLRRSFPQLLSLRDLDKFIGQAVNKDVIERSKSALEEAKNIHTVFVPTKAYNKAWSVLNKHCFVALEGPPEVGKTAIAWMIGLSLLSGGWESLVCDTPEDFFRQYHSESDQVFIADDAFGRTEYDPSRGKEWERYFERVVGRLDKRHWLIWTSRKYILERAMKTIDLQGNSRKLPSSSAVLVDAGELSVNEKALMLYRHARAAKLEATTKNILRNFASMIVKNPSFTPERIRGFVIEVLPELAKNIDDLNQENLALLRSEINRAIETPTDRMKKTFNVLSEHHKLVLALLLESESYASLETLRHMYTDRGPALSNNGQNFDDILDELSESFIKTTESGSY